MAKTVKKKQATRSDQLVAGLVDLLYQTRGARYKLNHAAAALEAKEQALRAQLIATLPKFGASGVAGRVARAQLETKQIVVVDNWLKFYAGVARTKAWDLLQRRVNVEAVQARWAVKKLVAGARPDQVTVVSLHKL